MDIEDDLAAILRPIQLLDSTLLSLPSDERWVSHRQATRLRNRANHLNQLATLYEREEEE